MLLISTAKLVSVLTLCSTLTGLVLAVGPRTQCIETVRALQGDNCDSFAQQAGVDRSVITSLNPGANCDALQAGDELCTRAFLPLCTLNATATSTTCGGLANQWQITTSDFIEYNDNVNQDCSNLNVGQQYCVSIQGCYPGNTDPVCSQGNK